MGSSSVPFAFHGFRIQRNVDTKVFCYAVQNVASHPQIISHRDTFTRTDLEFPLLNLLIKHLMSTHTENLYYKLSIYLGRHDFGIGARDIDAGVNGSSVVSFDYVSTKDFVGSNTAIIGSLRSGEPILGPAERVEIGIEQRVLLFDTKPRFEFGSQFHGFQTGVAMVRFGGFLVVLVGVAENQTIVSKTEGISVDGNRIQVHVGVATFCLICRATIVVPNG